MKATRLALLTLFLLLPSLPALAQHLGARQQWQPQLDRDARLQQEVRLEILGRAAGPALELLSTQTGVSLTIAPEDLDTVGERKFTLIAQGCSLKAVMVQLMEALQEAHWDVDWSAGTPRYLLHRNPGVDLLGLQQAQAREESDQARRRAARVARLDQAKAALHMTPEELRGLEQTDPILARAVQDQHARSLMELLFALPEELHQQFVQTGEVTLPFLQAPTALQQAAETDVGWFVADQGQRERIRIDVLGEPAPDIAKWKEKRSRATITLADRGSDFAYGIRLEVGVPHTDGLYPLVDQFLPARNVSTDECTGAVIRMLRDTGAPSRDAAWEIIRSSEREGFRRDRERTEARHKAEWIEPTDPDLLKVVMLSQDLKWIEIAQSLAKQTGLSIISDEFGGRRAYVSDEMVAGMPLWRLLYLLGESGRFTWHKVGGCLVIHSNTWYDDAQREVPESLLTTYREKLQAQGTFTLDDLAAFALVLRDRSAGTGVALPQDLGRAGLVSAVYARWGLACYASLSPQQLAAARTEAGLPYAAMTIAQRQLVAEGARRCRPQVASEEFEKAAFQVFDPARTQTRGGGASAIMTTGFRLQIRDQRNEEVAWTMKPAASAPQ